MPIHTISARRSGVNLSARFAPPLHPSTWAALFLPLSLYALALTLFASLLSVDRDAPVAATIDPHDCP
jgi:hypothetical protein